MSVEEIKQWLKNSKGRRVWIVCHLFEGDITHEPMSKSRLKELLRIYHQSTFNAFITATGDLLIG